MESTLRIKSMERGYLYGPMEGNTKGNGNLGNSMEKVFIH